MTIWINRHKDLRNAFHLNADFELEESPILDVVLDAFEDFQDEEEDPGSLESIFDINYILDLGGRLLRRFTNQWNWIVDHFSRFCWNWIKFSRIRFKFFKRRFNVFFFRRFTFLRKITRFKRIKNIVIFKKKTSFFKKKNKIELSFLKRIHMFKWKKSIFKKKPHRRRRRYQYSKYVDLHKRTNLIWYYNRSFFKKHLYLPKIRQKAKTKSFYSLLKSEGFSFLKYWDDSVLNLTIFLRLAPSIKEALFLSTSGLIFINGYQVSKFDTHVNYGDVVQIAMSDAFYKFYRWNIHLKQKFFKRVGYHLWILNRFRFNFYKQSTTRIPTFVDRVMFFYEDLPRFIEADFTTLTFILVLNKNKKKFFNFFFKKVPALNMLRLYNWKYIT